MIHDCSRLDWFRAPGFTIAIVLVAAAAGFAQPASPLVSIKDDWNASWIWRAGDDIGNIWVAFRKTVNLDAAPGRAIASIAVDSKYWMWINGEPVIREGGLKRGPTPYDTYYDEVDLSPYLTSGNNTIAILVWYWGRSGFSHLSSGKGGMLFDASIDGRSVVSDASWKVLRMLAFRESGAPGPNFRLPERNIFFDAAAYPAEWMTPEYDSNGWPNATVEGSASGPPWNRLYLRIVPQWRQSELLPYTNAASFPAIATGDTLLATLPRHAQVTPYLRIDAVAGDTIGIRTDRYAVPSIDGIRQINTLRTEYVTKDGVQEFETPAWMNGEAVLYYIPAGIRILDLRYRESGFDTDFVGSFSTDDPFFDKLWVKARATVYGTMRDYFMETAGRERKQATSDGTRALLSALYSMDARAQTLMRKFWAEFGDWRASNGAIRSGVPGNWLPEQPQINLYAYGDYGLWRYFLITNDRDVIETVYPQVRQYLLLWNMEPSGLVVHREGDWDWFDWEQNIDEPLIENALYQIALRGAIKMAKATGNEDDIPEWERRMESIHSSFNEQFWQGNFYMSDDHRGPPDDRGNALAYLAGLSEDRFKSDLNAVLRNEKHSSPYMDHFALKALFEMGDVEGGLARMKDRYSGMVSATSTTLREYWDPTIGSKEHPFAVGTLRLLTNHIAGIEPLTPGFELVRIEPNPGPLGRVRAEVPTDHGFVEVDLDRPARIEQNKPAQFLRVIIPEGTTARLGIPKPPGALDRIQVGDRIIWFEDGPADSEPGVRPIIETDTFVRFEVDPGQWQFDLYIKPAPARFSDVQVRSDGDMALLTWVTEEERDSTEFIIEERFDDQFAPIGIWAGLGPEGGEYEFPIEDPSPGWHTFRIRAIGTEGGIALSPEANLEVPGDKQISVSEFYPNPVDHTGTISLSVTEAQNVRGDIVNALGQRVRTVFNSYLEPGKRYRIPIQVSDLPSGVYVMVLIGNEMVVNRFVIAR
ncbi:MAG: T9SS type A sorting domain-containing protein [Rhodothermia bacterium]